MEIHRNGSTEYGTTLSKRARKVLSENWEERSHIDESNTAGYDKSKLIKGSKDEELVEKSMCAIEGVEFDWSGTAEFIEPTVNYMVLWILGLKPTTGCDKESDNSKENTDDSLKQQQKTATETSSVKSSLKVDKDWKEKFFYPANHVREEEPKKG
ncbi:hypothetical protein Tco_0496264 [Tanacetum coccineum]